MGQAQQTPYQYTADMRPPPQQQTVVQEKTLATKAVDYARAKLGDGLLLVCFLIGAATLWGGQKLKKRIRKVKRAILDESSQNIKVRNVE